MNITTNLKVFFINKNILTESGICQDSQEDELRYKEQG